MSKDLRKEFTEAIKTLNIERNFLVYGIAPKEDYKGLDTETIKSLCQIIKNTRYKIWDKSFWKLKVSDSICAVASSIDGDLKRLDKVFDLHS